MIHPKLQEPTFKTDWNFITYYLNSILCAGPLFQ